MYGSAIVKEKCQSYMGKQSWDLGNANTYPVCDAPPSFGTRARLIRLTRKCQSVEMFVVTCIPQTAHL